MKKKIFILLFVFIAISGNTFANSAKEKRDNFIACAKKYKGCPYLYGGTSSKGFDCSGFVYTAAKDAGITLPRSSAAMYKSSTKISDEERQAGDLVFFATGSSISHVGIYLGDNQMIHCASDGSQTGVIISKLSENYWKNHYYCAGRVIEAISEGKKDSQTTSDSKTEETTSNSSSEKNKIKNAHAYFSYGGFFDWSFYEPADNYAFWPKGGTFQTELQLHLWSINPGIMVRYTYPIQSYTAFDPSSLFNSFNLPVCLTIHLNDYVALYTGAVLSTDIVCKSPQILKGTDKMIKPNVYPGIFGITLQTPKIKLGSNYISLMQDVSYTCYQAAEGYEALTTKEALAAGLTFSTGLNITLPF